MRCHVCVKATLGKALGKYVNMIQDDSLGIEKSLQEVVSPIQTALKTFFTIAAVIVDTTNVISVMRNCRKTCDESSKKSMKHLMHTPPVPVLSGASM